MTHRFPFKRLLAAGGMVASLLAGASVAAAPAEVLRPSTTMPSTDTQESGLYYSQLLQWSRDVPIGPLTARVTYLDPPLYLAWLRQTTPDAGQAALEQGLAGFPTVLSFRVAYQAAERSSLHAKEWKLTLQGPDGNAIPASEGKRIAPPDLKSGPNGEFWEDDWDYRFPVPSNFLQSDDKGFAVTLTGPAGEAKATWTFGATQALVTQPDAYVPYLGATLTGLCVVLLAGLYVTRAPRALIV